MSFFSFKELLWSYFVMDIYSWKIIFQKWGYITIISIGNFSHSKITHFSFQLRIHFLTHILKKSSHFSSSTTAEKSISISITIASLFYKCCSKKIINFKMFFEVKSTKMRWLFMLIFWKNHSIFFVDKGIFFVIFFIYTKENRALRSFCLYLKEKKCPRCQKFFYTIF